MYSPWGGTRTLFYHRSIVSWLLSLSSCIPSLPLRSSVTEMIFRLQQQALWPDLDPKTAQAKIETVYLRWVKSLRAMQKRRCRRHGFDPWVWKIPWSRAWQLTPVFMPRESHGQRSLVGYSPLGHKELDTTEVTEYTHMSRSVSLQTPYPICLPPFPT